MASRHANLILDLAYYMAKASSLVIIVRMRRSKHTPVTLAKLEMDIPLSLNHAFAGLSAIVQYGIE